MRVELLLPIALLVGGCESPKPAKSPPNEVSNSSAEKPHAESETMPMEVFEAPGIGDPPVEFVNPTDRALTVALSGPAELKVEVPPMQSRSIKLAAGNYAVLVLGADVSNAEPLKFDIDRRYRVVLKLFYEMDDPRYLGKGLECVPYAGPVQYYLCGRTKQTCEFYRRGTPPGIDVGECGHFNSMFGFRANLPAGVMMVFTSTAGDCDTFRAAWLKDNPGVTATACERTE